MFEPNVRKAKGPGLFQHRPGCQLSGRSPARSGAGYQVSYWMRPFQLLSVCSSCETKTLTTCLFAHVHWCAQFQRWWCRRPFPSWARRRVGGLRGDLASPLGPHSPRDGASPATLSGQARNCPVYTHWCLYQIGHMQLVAGRDSWQRGAAVSIRWMVESAVWLWGLLSTFTAFQVPDEATKAPSV